MRRLLAALAAALMIVAGFFVWSARTQEDSPDVEATDTNGGASGSDQIMVACIREADQACSAIAGLANVSFVTADASSTEKLLAGGAAARPDAWVTTALGYERVRLVATSFTKTATIASTRVVVVTRTGSTSPAAACKGALECLATTAKVSFPSVTAMGAGLTIATEAVLAKAEPGSVPVTADEIDGSDKVLDGLRSATRTPASKGDLALLTSVKLIDAVVLTEAELRVKPPVGLSSKQADAAPIPIVLITGPTVSKARAEKLAARLQDALAENGFDAPGASSDFPDPIIAKDVAGSLS